MTEPQANGDGVDPAKLPPFVQIIKTDTGINVASNLADGFLALALLEMAKAQIIKSLTAPKVVTPPVGMAGLMSRIRP